MRTSSLFALIVVLLTAASEPVCADDARLTATVAKRDLKIDIEVPGVFVAEDKNELRVEPKEYKGELIVTMIKPEGITVKKDDVLMEFEADKLDNALEDAQSEVTDAEVALKKSEAEFKSAEIDAETAVAQLKKELEFAQREVDAATEQQVLELSKKEKDLEDSIQQLADAEIDFEQLKELYEERELHTATEDILIEREEHKIAKITESIERKTKELAHFKKFEKTKEAMTKEIEVAKKQAELKKKEITVKAELSEKESLVAKAKRKLEREQKKHANLKVDKSQLKIVSPRDGVLFYRTTGGSNPAGVVVFGRNSSNELRVGGRVKTHEILLTVATMETLSVKMQVLENDIQHMKTGLPMTVRPDAFPAMELAGKLTKVDQIASRTGIFSDVRRFSVKGAYEGVASPLRSGMNCRVTVHADSVPDAVQIPVVAVMEEGGDYHCFVKNGTEAVKRKVKIGMSNDESVEITEGLKPKEVVYLYDPTR